MTDLLLLVVKY